MTAEPSAERTTEQGAKARAPAGPTAASPAADVRPLPGWSPGSPPARLPPPSLAGLQRSAGNRATANLLRVQRAPALAGKPAAKTSAPKKSSFDSYADLLNGFQELAAAFNNKGGKGLDTVRMGKDLAPAHRSLLWTTRVVLIQAQGSDQDAKRRAIHLWPGLAKKLNTAVEEARGLGLSRGGLAATADAIEILGRRFAELRGEKVETRSAEDVVETVLAIDALLQVNAGLVEAGAGIQREEAPGRADVQVSGGMVELNQKYRDRLQAVKVGQYVSTRHAALVEALRSALILMRTEKANSANAARVKWHQIEGELRYMIESAKLYAATYPEVDPGSALGRLQATRAIIDQHYGAVHRDNLQVLLSKKRDPGEIQARQKVAKTFGGDVARGLAEKTSVEDFRNALDVIQNHLVKSPERPGEWVISNGPSSMRIWEADALSLRAKAAGALKTYMQELYSALVHAQIDYEDILRGTNKFKRSVLGFFGGADDPGDFSDHTRRLWAVRQNTVFPLVEAGKFVEAFDVIIKEKPAIEIAIKREHDYDMDLDKGYSRLSTTMKVVQVALVSLVPVAGEAALAVEGTSLLAVGGTAIASGSGGAALAETGRQLYTGERDIGKVGSAAWSGGVIGAGAIAPGVTRSMGGSISRTLGTSEAFGEYGASAVVGGTQSKLGGGTFTEGAVGGGLGWGAGKATPKPLQQGVPSKVVQAGTGAGVAAVTGQDPIAGATGGLVGSFAKPPPAGPPKGPPGGKPPPHAGDTVPGTESAVKPPAPPPPGAGDTIPGPGIPQRPPAPPPGAGDTIPGTGIPRRPPAPPPGAGDTIPGTGIARRPPATPPPGDTLPGPGIAPTTPGGPAPKAPAPPLGETAQSLPGHGMPGGPVKPPAGGPASKWARLPEYAGHKPLFGEDTRVVATIEDGQKAAQLYDRVYREGQRHILETTHPDATEFVWVQDAGFGAGKPPAAWVREDGTIRFNLEKFKRPDFSDLHPPVPDLPSRPPPGPGPKPLMYEDLVKPPPGGVQPRPQGFAKLPEYEGLPPIFGPESRVTSIIDDPQAATALYERVKRQAGGQSISTTTHDDATTVSWAQAGGEGHAPAAWIRTDGVVHFNFAKIDHPDAAWARAYVASQQGPGSGGSGGSGGKPPPPSSPPPAPDNPAPPPPRRETIPGTGIPPRPPATGSGGAQHGDSSLEPPAPQSGDTLPGVAAPGRQPPAPRRTQLGTGIEPRAPGPNLVTAAELNLAAARAERQAADARLAQARAATEASDNAADQMGLHAAEAGPALEVARAKLAEARAARELADLRLAASRAGGPERSRLGREAALARSNEGYAEVALGAAQNQAVRAQRVTEGIALGQARAADRANRITVEPINDPDVAARAFIEGRGGAGGNLPLQRRRFEDEWRSTHEQLVNAPAAGWRRADGTVVIDVSNPAVRAAVERLARERSGPGGGGPPASPGSGGGQQATPQQPATPRRPGSGEGSQEPAGDTRPDIPLPRTTRGSSGAPPTQEPVKVGAHVIRSETRADARAKARAAEFAPLYFEWQGLHPVERQARIEQLINAHLATEGVAKVHVNMDDKAPAGDASFNFQTWKVNVSQKTLEKETIKPHEFAELVDNATHEARHTVHHFRGLRIALSEGHYDASAKIPKEIVDEARAANQRKSPRDELSKEAYGEAKEIYEVTHLEGPRRQRIEAEAKAQGKELGSTDIVSRSAVIQRRDDLFKQHAAADQKVKDLEKQGKTGTDEYRQAVADRALAYREAIRAHNEYTALPQETDAWRYGSAVRKATEERLAIMMRVNGAELARQRAEKAAQEARARQDDTGYRRAADEYVKAYSRRRAAERELEALTPTQPRVIDGRPLAHEVPADASLGVPPRRTGAGTQVVRPDTGGDEMSVEPPGEPTPAPKTTPRPPVQAPAGPKPVAPAPQTGDEHDEPAKEKQPARWGGDQYNLARERSETRTTRTGTTTRTKFVSGGSEGPKAGVRTRTEEPSGDVKETSADARISLIHGAGFTLKDKREQAPAEGAPPGAPAQGTEKKATVHVTPTEIRTNVEAMRHTAGGTQHGATAGGSYDFATGNTSGQAGYRVQSKGGHGAHAEVTSGNSVFAEEPDEVEEGVWEVRYVISDSSGVAGGVSAKAGAVEFGLNASDTDAKLKTGSRRFKDEKLAAAFKKNIRQELAGEIAGATTYLPPPTTVAGALMIAEGETRGTGSSNTKAGGGSVGVATGSLGKSSSTSSGFQLEVTRVKGSTIRVTTTVSTESGGGWSASGLGLTNVKGGSESEAFSVTYEFDVSKAGEGAAFEMFCRFPLPSPAGKMPFSVRRLTAQEEHDNYSLLWGTAGYGGFTSQDITTDAQGEHARYTGGQTEDVSPGRLLGLFEDEKHARAEIVSRLENGKEAGYAAKFAVSGESGEFNRRQFGRIFLGARYSGEAKASGKWNLTADIPMEAVHTLERSSKAFKNATTQDEKLRIYSELVKDRGAEMLGGQVGLSSLAWTLELKGDENFPGQRGRARLKQIAKTLAAALKTNPESADEAVRVTGEELEKLGKRREAVANPEKYTDLPDGLREQQLRLIDSHIEELKAVRRNAQATSMKRASGEKGAAGAADRLKKDRYDLELKAKDREVAKTQDTIEVTEKQIANLRTVIHDSSKALGDVIGGKGSIALRLGIDRSVGEFAVGAAKGFIAAANAADKQQNALQPQIDAARDAFTAAHEPAARLAALKTLAVLLEQRRKLLQETLDAVRQAGKAVYHVATRRSKAGNEWFWETLGESEKEEEGPDPTAGVSMTL